VAKLVDDRQYIFLNNQLTISYIHQKALSIRGGIMAEEYIYLKDYLALIEWLYNRFGGKLICKHSDAISRQGLSYAAGRDIASIISDSDNAQDEAQDIHSFESYPAYYATIEEVPFGMSLSGRDVFYISLGYELNREIRVRHELWVDKMHKMLGLIYEFQTADIAFDKKYFIECKDSSDHHIFLDATFRELIRKLEPFGRIVITCKRLATSRSIECANDLHPSSIKEIIDLLLKMARYIKK
jgi:hypothetical protein